MVVKYELAVKSLFSRPTLNIRDLSFKNIRDSIDYSLFYPMGKLVRVEAKNPLDYQEKLDSEANKFKVEDYVRNMPAPTGYIIVGSDSGQNLFLFQFVSIPASIGEFASVKLTGQDYLKAAVRNEREGVIRKRFELEDCVAVGNLHLVRSNRTSKVMHQIDERAETYNSKDIQQYTEMLKKEKSQ